MQPVPPPADLLTDLAPEVPIALLPLRLEIRFGAREEITSEGAPQPIRTLRVRIYPDEISVTAPQGLSPTEISAGQQFWAAQTTGDGADDGASRHRRTAAWELLVQHVGSRRAVVTARCTRDGAPPEETVLDDAPTARLLPDAWVIVGETPGATAFVHYVSRPVQAVVTGPSRSEPAFDPRDALLRKPEDATRWMSDFDAAVRAGMAAEIDLETPAQAASGEGTEAARTGLSSLYVLGVHGATPEVTAVELGKLLSAHADASELSFLSQGTATNNLGEARSGWSPSADPYAGYRQVTEPPAPPAPLGSDVSPLRGGAPDGSVLETALGLPDGTLSAVPGAGGHEQWLARNMARALFPVTFGDVIQDLSVPRDTGAQDSAAAQVEQRRHQDATIFAREHVSSFLRARGPLPTLRIGRNPYGVLPVMAVDDWAPHPAEAPLTPGLGDVLATVRWYFERAARSVPRLDGATDPSTALHNILSMSPVPHEGGYLVTDVLGGMSGHILQTMKLGVEALGQDLTVALDAGGPFTRELTPAAIRLLVGRSLGTRLRHSDLEEFWILGSRPMLSRVAHTDATRARGASPAEYLSDLLDRFSRFASLRIQPPGQELPPPPPDDLLYVLVERSLFRAGELDGDRLLDLFAPGLLTAAKSVPRELSGSALPIETPLIRLRTEALSQLSEKAVDLPEEAIGRTVREIVMDRTDLLEHILRGRSPTVAEKREINTLAGTRDSVRVLAQAGETELDDEGYARLTSETLACASTRLDAWYTSLAVQRLAVLRQSRREGLHVGSWGVLVDVRPRTVAETGQPGPGTHPEDAEPGPVVPSRWRDHLTALGASAPSELRAPAERVGYVHAPSLSQAATGGVLRAGELARRGQDSTIASFDLTSARVRTALEILEAMSHGQPLGALLGYRLERTLHEQELHSVVARLRQDYPQRRTGGAVGEPAAGDDAVVPDEVVDGYDVWRARDAVLGVFGAEMLGPALQELDDTVEAVADLLVAEGVHGIATGRQEAAGATFTAIADGRTPPEVTVAEEPRSGITITHRVLLGLAADPPSSAQEGDGWNSAASRALLAPGVEHWARSVLGPATPYAVRRPAPDGAEPAAVPLPELGLCALDVVVESALGRDGLPSIAARCLGDADFDLLLDTARAAADLLAACRPAAPVDLYWPQEPEHGTAGGKVGEPPVPGLDQLQPVMDAVEEQLHTLDVTLDALRAALGTAGTGGTVDAGLLAGLVALGLPDAVTATARAPLGQLTGTSVDATAALAALFAAEAVRRDVLRLVAQGPVDALVPVNWAASMSTVAASAAPLATLTAITRRLGGDAVVPSVALTVPVPPVAGVTRNELQRWLSRTARVRPAVACYDDLCLFGEAAGAPAPDLTALHLPPTEGLAWLGGPLTPEQLDGAPGNPLRRWKRPVQPHAHLVLAGTTPVPGTALHALVVDEVAEVLPAPTVTTGLAAHYEAPSARAPQGVLLAVPPHPGAPWTWEVLHRTVREAMDLVRLRGVELDDLSATGLAEYLPLTYLQEGGDSLLPLRRLTDLRPWQRCFFAAFRLFEGGQ